MHIVMTWLGILRRLAQKAGPYLLLEILMPGGTLLALLLFLYRRKKSGTGGGAERAIAVATRTLASVFEQHVWVPVPIRLVPRRSTMMRSEQ